MKKRFIFLSALGLILLTSSSFQNAFAAQTHNVPRINFNDNDNNGFQHPWNQDIQIDDNENVENDITLSVSNDISNDSIEVIQENRDTNGSWGDEDNCVVSKGVGPLAEEVISYSEPGNHHRTLLSYRYQGRLYQYEIDEILDESKVIKLSDFELQQVDNYSYGN